MNLLLYFALPVSTVILASVFQRIIKSPILVAATAFAIYLIVVYSAFDSSYLIFAIIYTILAFISAYITKIIGEVIGRNGLFNNINAENINTNNLTTNNLEVNDDNSSSCSCNNRYSAMRRYWK